MLSSATSWLYIREQTGRYLQAKAEPEMPCWSHKNNGGWRHVSQGFKSSLMNISPISWGSLYVRAKGLENNGKAVPQ